MSHRQGHQATSPGPKASATDLDFIMSSRERENEIGTSDGECQRNNSLTSLNSLKSVVSSLKKVTRADSKKSDTSITSSSGGPETKMPLDTLPDTRTGLEGRLNHHLSELDYIRRLVQTRNEEIKDACSRAAHQHRLRATLPCSVHMLDETINALRQQRNSLFRYVEFHQNEIKRIAERRKELDAEQGLECTVYQMYMRFQRESEWVQLFSI